MSNTRVVLAVDSAKRRALMRVGLELSGEFDVVGVATDERDVASVVRTLRPDVVLVDLADAPDRGLGLVPVVRRSCPTARPVLYEGLVARHEAHLFRLGHAIARAPRPIEIARLLLSVVRPEPAGAFAVAG